MINFKKVVSSFPPFGTSHLSAHLLFPLTLSFSELVVVQLFPLEQPSGFSSENLHAHFAPAAAISPLHPVHLFLCICLLISHVIWMCSQRKHKQCWVYFVRNLCYSTVFVIVQQKHCNSHNLKNKIAGVTKRSSAGYDSLAAAGL